MEVREGYRVLLPCSSTTTLAAMTMEVPLDPGEVEALEVYVAHKWIPGSPLLTQPFCAGAHCRAEMGQWLSANG